MKCPHLAFHLSNAILLLSQLLADDSIPAQSTRIYLKGHQFPDNSEFLPLPKIVAFSIFMGKVSYPHMRLTFESMKYNPRVQFVLINVIEKFGDSDTLSTLKDRYHIHNFHLEAISFRQFSARVKDRLGIEVEFDHSWFYKMTDYKPTLAHLFPDVISKLSATEAFKYWGYVDLDLVWGNFTRFSYLFQGDYAVITSGKTTTTR